MVPEEHRIFNDVGEAWLDSSKKMKPNKLPQRGPGIAMLEKLRIDDPQKYFPASTELLVHPIPPQSNPHAPFIAQFDSRSSIEPANPLVSSSGRAPMLRSSFQSDASSCPKPPLPIPSLFPRQENRQKISQVSTGSTTNYFIPVPGACFQMKSEPPSIQNSHFFLNPPSWTDQQRTTHQRVGMKRPWPFQTHESKNQIVVHPDCDTMMINGPQENNSDWLTVEGNLNRNHPAVERNFLSILKKTKEDPTRKTSAASETLISYNFMGLRNTDYAADPHVTANQIKRSLEGFDDVDVDLKL